MPIQKLEADLNTIRRWHHEEREGHEGESFLPKAGDWSRSIPTMRLMGEGAPDRWEPILCFADSRKRGVMDPRRMAWENWKKEGFRDGRAPIVAARWRAPAVMLHSFSRDLF